MTSSQLGSQPGWFAAVRVIKCANEFPRHLLAVHMVAVFLQVVLNVFNQVGRIVRLD